LRNQQFKQVLKNIDATCESFLETISDGVYILDRDGRFLYVNKAIEKRSGIPFDELIGTLYLDIVGFKDRERLKAVFDRVMRGEHVAPFEVSYRTADGREGYAELNSRPIFHEGKVVGVQGVSRDVTRKKQAEAALKQANAELDARVQERTEQLKRANQTLEAERDSLQQSEATIRALLNAVTEVLFLTRTDGTILALNDTAAKRFGKTTEEAVGLNLKELLEPEVLERRKLQAAPAMLEGKPVRFEDERQNRVFRTSVYPVKGSEGAVRQLAVFGVDVTARKSAERKLLAHQSKLRSLALQLSLAEERQRRRIAVEVHDEIGQNLAFAKMKLGELRRHQVHGVGLEILDEVGALIDGAIQDTRALVSELGSPVLYELGFVPAVEGMCREIEVRHRLNVVFKDDRRTKPLANDVQVLLFQSLREVLTNVLKHARADTVEVSLSVQADWLHIDVRDNGEGFDLLLLDGKINEQKSFGIFSIQQRLESLGGDMKIESAPGKGTRITLTAPLGQTTSGKE